MDQCEDREEGVLPSKSSLCEEHDSQTKAQSPEQQHRPDSAGPGLGPGPGSGPSCVSFKSDQSIYEPIEFKSEQQSADRRIHQKRPDYYESSCVSMKSDRSMGPLISSKMDSNLLIRDYRWRMTVALLFWGTKYWGHG
eukprot:superscaffoldBa00004650_g19234